MAAIMSDNLHAILLLLMIGAAIFLVVKFGIKKNRIITSIIATVLFSILLIVPTIIQCACGQPIHQWFISSALAFVLIATIEKKSIKTISMIVLYIVSIGIVMQYAEIINSPYYASELTQPIKQENRTMHVLRSEIMSVNLEPLALPQGNLINSLNSLRNKQFAEVLSKIGNTHYYRYRVKWLWHSLYTGIYEMEKGAEVYLWFPGGPLKESIDKIELRESK